MTGVVYFDGCLMEYM